MKYLIAAAVAAGLTLTSAAGYAETVKKIRKPHVQMQPAPDPRSSYGVRDPSWGNAAAGGNNANSMSGSNSAGENANGRTSGGGYGG